MPAAAGAMNERVQLLRRSGDTFSWLGPWQWGSYQFERTSNIQVGTLAMQGKSGRLTIRGGAVADNLRSSDRVEMGGEQYAISMIRRKATSTDDTMLEIELAPTPNVYEAEMTRRGENITLLRVVPNAPAIEVTVRAIVTGYTPNELTGGIMQGDRRVYVLASDVVASGFPLPIQSGKSDRLRIRGRLLAIQSIDDNTHRIAGELCAYEITARG